MAWIDGELDWFSGCQETFVLSKSMVAAVTVKIRDAEASEKVALYSICLPTRLESLN